MGGTERKQYVEIRRCSQSFEFPEKICHDWNDELGLYFGSAKVGIYFQGCYIGFTKCRLVKIGRNEGIIDNFTIFIVPFFAYWLIIW